MPFGEKVECSKCKKTETFLWHQGSNGVQCNECYENEHQVVKVVEEEEQKAPAPVEKPKTPTKKTPKTTRSYKTRQNPNALPKQVAPKGKGRRSLFKKNPPIKLQAPGSTFVTVDSVNHKGQHFRIGDIVSVRDVDGGIYYCQIKGLMLDQYCEKSASIRWLIPTKTDSPFPIKGFDPMTFVAGPDDDSPRRIECFEFVMHAPSDYFRDNSPYPSGQPHPTEAGYVWGRLKPPQPSSTKTS